MIWHWYDYWGIGFLLVIGLELIFRAKPQPSKIRRKKDDEDDD